MTVPSYMRPTKSSAAKQVDPASLPMNLPKLKPFYVGKYPRPTPRKATPQTTTVKVERPPRSTDVFERLQEQTFSSAAKITKKFESTALPYFYTGVKPFVLIPLRFQRVHRKPSASPVRRTVPLEFVTSKPVLESNTPSVSSTPSLVYDSDSDMSLCSQSDESFEIAPIASQPVAVFASGYDSNVTLFSETDPDGSFEVAPVNTRPTAESPDELLSFGDISESSILVLVEPVEKMIAVPEIAEVRASFTLSPSASAPASADTSSQDLQDASKSAEPATVTFERDISNSKCLSPAASSVNLSDAAIVESTPREICASSSEPAEPEPQAAAGSSPTQLESEDSSSSDDDLETCDLAALVDRVSACRRLWCDPSTPLTVIQEEEEDREEAPLQDANIATVQQLSELIIKASEDAASDLVSEVSPAECRPAPAVHDGILQFMLAAQRTRVLFDALQSSRPTTKKEYDDSSDDDYEDDGSKTQDQQESCWRDHGMHRDTAATAACDSSNLEDDSSEYDSEYEEEPEAAGATDEYITAAAVIERNTAADHEAIARRCEELNAQLPKYSLALKTSIERSPVTKLVVSPKPKGILKRRYDMYYYQESAKKLNYDYSYEPMAPEVYISVSDSASIPRPQARVHFPPRRKLEAVRLIEPRLGGGPGRSVRRKGCSSGNIGGVLGRISQWWS